ncbi:MAG: GH3 auxin-responsive promoter family protein [Prolixibacteraceae bacterium]|nr:GH3 auxin-responsive promoter family protein [Prolixibacteraceae bacterium]MBN2648250.1 GH3 auxin-responsive promoter family protein [Prolixibacteraceae bacterium]
MIEIFNRGIEKIFSTRYKKYEYFSKYPVEQQEKVLQELIRKAENTEWGINHGYPGIQGSSAFKSNVPLGDYETLKPYIERMVEGEKNILWPGTVRWFAKSSGTTNDKSKFIPVSDDSLDNCHLKASVDVFAHYLKSNPDTQFLKGKNLTIGGSHKVSNLNKSIRTGDLSAVMLHNLPFLSRFKNTPPSEIALIPDFEEKIEKIAHSTINENITSFAGVPSWFLVLIKRILEISGKDNLLEVWPNLEVFVHGGINFEPYHEQYKKLIPSATMRYMNTYNASEGFFALQNDLSTDDMLLMLDNGIYYEFIDMAHFFDNEPEALGLDQVETGRNYAMVISTNGGLWRYIIGDTVMFTQKYPFKIKITGRTRHFINAFGEELIINNAIKGLDAACEITGATICEFTAGPVFMDTEHKGCHQWIIEFENEPENIEQFAKILDQELQKVNSDYEAKRFKNLTLKQLEIINAPKGTFYNWMKTRGKVGGQNKIPRLANDREYLDSLLKQINTQP